MGLFFIAHVWNCSQRFARGCLAVLTLEMEGCPSPAPCDPWVHASICICQLQWVNVLTSSWHVPCPFESQDLSSASISANCSSCQLAITAIGVVLLAQQCNFLSALFSGKWNHCNTFLHSEVPKQNEALQAGEKGSWEELLLPWGGETHVRSVIASDSISKHMIRCVLDLSG